MANPWVDPSPYDGPIQRLDGRRPFNRYLWPMAGDDWWAYNTPKLRRVSGRFHFSVVALADGRWSTSGSVYSIEENRDCYGYPCVFPTREQAVRVAAARFVRMCRHARAWDGVDHLSHELCQHLVNWVLDIADRPPAVLRPLALPMPTPKPTGLPLLDYGAAV